MLCLYSFKPGKRRRRSWCRPFIIRGTMYCAPTSNGRQTDMEAQRLQTKEVRRSTGAAPNETGIGMTRNVKEQGG